VPQGFARNGVNDVRSWTFGVSYKPIAQIVVKADYQRVRNRARTGVNQWNIGLGWLF
jgi:hypothetical protein